MSAVFELTSTPALFAAREAALPGLARGAAPTVPFPVAHRTQNRALETEPRRRRGRRRWHRRRATDAAATSPRMTRSARSRGEMTAAPDAESSRPAGTAPERSTRGAPTAVVSAAVGRRASRPRAHASGFHNAADTDPSLPANRAWGRAILGPRRGHRTLGVDTIAAARDRRRRRARRDHRHRRHRRRRLGPEERRRARRACCTAPATALAREPRPPDRGDGRRDRQDHRRGRPRDQRGDRLRPLLRRARQGPRRACRAPSSCRRRSPSSPRRGTSRSPSPPVRVLVGARRRLRCHHQAGQARPALRRGHGRGALGGRRSARPARPRRPRRPRPRHASSSRTPPSTASS